MIKSTVSFRIAGDLIAPGEISAVTGLEPTSLRLDTGRRHPRPFSSEAWEIAVGPLVAETAPPGGIGPMLRRLEQVLSEPAERIRRYCAAHDLIGLIEVWIESSDGTLPEIEVTPGFAQLAADLRADIDFDFYLWLGEEWKAENRPSPTLPPDS
ncbi:MAG: DUF4279 domain-containing protein [Bifidobacteriaceae bacterium]|jgi:hypothetical protein|nr:DUF4279 domain-containing protein [Bifidobacteriaceae bacterium]